MNTKSNTKLSEEENSELESLEARLAELKSKSGKSSIKKESRVEKIKQDDYIPVMSLIPHPLNLSTKEAGQGDIKKFKKFGEIKNILYKDLVNIMEAHPTFLENGYYYILDERFIRELGLDELYSRILTKEKIEEILTTNSEECVKLYNSANEEQGKTIIDLLVAKVVADPNSINLNVVDKLSRASGVDIMEKAGFAKVVQTREAE